MKVARNSATLFFFLLVLAVYTFSSQNVSNYRKRVRSSDELLYFPPVAVVEIASMNFKSIVSKLLFFKAAVYNAERIDSGSKPDWNWLQNVMEASTLLDPYNIDSYYFTQAIFTWGPELIEEANQILQRGEDYRDWDYYLPFFLGFNYSHFLKDNKEASIHFRKAAKLNPQLVDFAIRSHFLANEIPIAIAILKTIRQNAKNDQVKNGVSVRIRAYEGALILQKGIRKYIKKHGSPPDYMDWLVKEGFISEMPKDPYGGTFYYDTNDSSIKSTSRFRTAPPQERTDSGSKPDQAF